MKMVDISIKMYKRNGTETIVDNDGLLWLKKTKTKYNSNHRKNWHKLIQEPKKQVNRFFIDEKLVIKVIVDCRTTLTYKFWKRLGPKQHFNKAKISVNKNNESTWRWKNANTIWCFKL